MEEMEQTQSSVILQEPLLLMVDNVEVLLTVPMLTEEKVPFRVQLLTKVDIVEAMAKLKEAEAEAEPVIKVMVALAHSLQVVQPDGKAVVKAATVQQMIRPEVTVLSAAAAAAEAALTTCQEVEMALPGR